LRLIATSVANTLADNGGGVYKSESLQSLDSNETVVRNNLGVMFEIGNEISLDSLDANSLAGEATLNNLLDRAAHNDDDEAVIED
jgi:hypothetical protein